MYYVDIRSMFLFKICVMLNSKNIKSDENSIFSLISIGKLKVIKKLIKLIKIIFNNFK